MCAGVFCVNSRGGPRLTTRSFLQLFSIFNFLFLIFWDRVLSDLGLKLTLTGEHLGHAGFDLHPCPGFQDQVLMLIQGAPYLLTGLLSFLLLFIPLFIFVFFLILFCTSPFALSVFLFYYTIMKWKPFPIKSVENVTLITLQLWKTLPPKENCCWRFSSVVEAWLVRPNQE